MSKIGETIREYRLACNVTKEELAAKSGIEEKRITAIETGYFEKLSGEEIGAISFALGVNPREFFAKDEAQYDRDGAVDWAVAQLLVCAIREIVSHKKMREHFVELGYNDDAISQVLCIAHADVTDLVDRAAGIADKYDGDMIKVLKLFLARLERDIKSSQETPVHVFRNEFKPQENAQKDNEKINWDF